MNWFKIWYNENTKKYIIITGDDMNIYGNCQFYNCIFPKERETYTKILEKKGYVQATKEEFIRYLIYA